MRIPAELRVNPLATVGRTIRELATAGRVTVGLAAWALVEGGVLVAAGLARQPVALGVTRLERRGERIWGVPVRGVGAVQAEPKSVLNFPLGAKQNAAIGVYASGEFVAPVSGRMRVSGTVDNELRINGELALRFGGTANVLQYSRDVEAGERLLWEARNTGGFAGGGFSVSFPVVDAVDWGSAVAALEWAATGTGAPWWGTIEASAKAGLWVRRLSWADYGRRVRYVAGVGTARAVAVDQDGVRLTPEGFGAAEFLGTDWLLADGGEPEPVDVTEWSFTAGPEAVAWLVAEGESPESGGGDGGDEDGAGLEAPGLGDYVRMSRGGRRLWVQTGEFTCPVE